MSFSSCSSFSWEVQGSVHPPCSSCLVSALKKQLCPSQCTLKVYHAFYNTPGHSSLATSIPLVRHRSPLHQTSGQLLVTFPPISSSPEAATNTPNPFFLKGPNPNHPKKQFHSSQEKHHPTLSLSRGVPEEDCYPLPCWAWYSASCHPSG